MIITTDRFNNPQPVISNYEEPISITVTSDEIHGPISGKRKGDSFSCSESMRFKEADGEDFVQVVEFNGEIDDPGRCISGQLKVKHYAGDNLVREELSLFKASRVMIERLSNRGEYQGQAFVSQTVFG
ncbi:MAG: hypothetical protein HKN50_04605 [Gammaproteobacteria bacterium]|nr:hypothetical protein [Gammaproteobacteria bacterium]